MRCALRDGCCVLHFVVLCCSSWFVGCCSVSIVGLLFGCCLVLFDARVVYWLLVVVRCVLRGVFCLLCFVCCFLLVEYCLLCVIR